MGFSGARKAVLAATLVALAIAGSAAAQESERGIDPNQGRSLVEVNLPDKAAAIELQLEADDYGIDFNDHYLRTNADGSVTVTVFGNADELAALEAAGFELGTTIEGPATWRQRAEDWQADVQAEETAEAAVARPRERRGGAERRHHRAPRRLLRELRGPLPLRRGEGRHARFLHHRRVARGRVEHRRGHGDRSGPAHDERQHRPGHDAGHLHRAPHSREGRRGQHLDPGGADADPDRLEQRHVRRGRRQHLARRRPAADEPRTSSATSRPGTSTRPRSTAASASWRRSSRT